MILAWMVYAILLGAAASLVALLAERAAMAHGARLRFIWMAAIAVTVAAPIVALAANRAAPAVTSDSPLPAAEGALPSIVSTGDPSSLLVPPALSALDGPILVGWFALSSLLLMAIVVAMVMLARRRRDWQQATIDGHDVLVTTDVGPAVAGLRRMRVLFPTWALGLERELRAIMLTHETEHIRARDPWLVVAAGLIVVVAPWNLTLWYQLRRLRLAVEMDCDRRVLRTHPGVRRYAALLVAVGARRSRLPFAAPALAESRSSLERRIDLMTSPRLRHPIVHTVAAIATAGVVLAVACDAPRPEPAAPEASSSEQAEELPLFDFQVDAVATLLPGSRPPNYPDSLRAANVKGTVLVTFIVDEQGRPEMESFRVIESTHELFTESVRARIPDLRFRPARSDGNTVRMWVQQPFVFRP